MTKLIFVLALTALLVATSGCGDSATGQVDSENQGGTPPAGATREQLDNYFGTKIADHETRITRLEGFHKNNNGSNGNGRVLTSNSNSTPGHLTTDDAGGKGGDRSLDLPRGSCDKAKESTQGTTPSTDTSQYRPSDLTTTVNRIDATVGRIETEVGKLRTGQDLLAESHKTIIDQLDGMAKLKKSLRSRSSSCPSQADQAEPPATTTTSLYESGTGMGGMGGMGMGMSVSDLSRAQRQWTNNVFAPVRQINNRRRNIYLPGSRAIYAEDEYGNLRRIR